MLKPPLTRVVLVDHSPSSIGILAFGRPFGKEVVESDDDGVQVVYHFMPGQRFSAVWREVCTNRSQHWIIVVAEALQDPSVGIRLPGITPPVAVHAILDQHTPAGYDGNVDQCLDLIDRLKRNHIDPARVSGRYWETVACRIILGEEPIDPMPSDLESAGEPPCAA
jgi:hypothetical protein